MSDDPFATVRAAANIAGRGAAMAQSRADFKLVWWAERAYGYLGADEWAREYGIAKANVRARLGDDAFMSALNAHLRTLAAAIERDRARSHRIATEVRAARALTQEKP